MRPRTKANIFLLVLFVLCVAAIVFLWHISKAEAATYAFYPTDDGHGQRFATSSNYAEVCPCLTLSCWTGGGTYNTGANVALERGRRITGTEGDYDTTWSYTYPMFRFDTSVLAGQTITGGTLKLVISINKNETWSALFDFRSDCLHSPLVAGDTTCWVDADTTIASTAFPNNVNDTMSVALRPDQIGTTTTDVILKLSTVQSACAATIIHGIDFYPVETSGTSKDPRLYVTTQDEPPASGPTHCVFSKSRIQNQVNNNDPKHLRIGSPGRGVGKMAATS